MICALAFHDGDAHLALDLLQWIEELGSAKEHDLILVTSPETQWPLACDVMAAANRAFRQIQFSIADTTLIGWPNAANAMFMHAAKLAADRAEAFLWIEPDAVPLEAAWLRKIAEAYTSSNATFMGHLYKWESHIPEKLMSGIGVYPATAWSMLERTLDGRAWDVSAANTILPLAKDTLLIRHHWGTHNMSPTFLARRTAGSPINAFVRDDIPAGAVLYHRCKDGSLLRLLRNKGSAANAAERFVVVLPFWNGDAQLLLRLLRWMQEMGMPKTHDCLLSYDQTTLRGTVSDIETRARAVFNAVLKTHYKASGAWPQTQAWRHAASQMYVSGRNWFWCEPDVVPMKPNWLLALQDFYDKCGKPFAGPHVHVSGHVNGTSIYAWNTPELLPNTWAMAKKAITAWDSYAGPEMLGQCADSNALLFHVWGEHEGKLHPVIGSPPHFRNAHLVNQIPKTAVAMHRCKDSSLIDRLKEKIK